MAKLEFNEEGFNDFEKQIEKMKSVKSSYSLEEMFPDSFMRLYTKNKNIGEFMNNCGYPCSNQNEFDKIPVKQFDLYVKQNTKFKSWKNMQETALQELLDQEFDS